MHGWIRSLRIAQKGEPGEERTLDLELKTIAQAALIGEPSSQWVALRWKAFAAISTRAAADLAHGTQPSS